MKSLRDRLLTSALTGVPEPAKKHDGGVGREPVTVASSTNLSLV